MASHQQNHTAGLPRGTNLEHDRPHQPGLTHGSKAEGWQALNVLAQYGGPADARTLKAMVYGLGMLDSVPTS